MADYRLHVFRIAAEQLNFTQAARWLHISQPAVTQHIKLLEEHYGQALFLREPGGLKLTAAGRALYEHVIEAEALHADLEKRLQAGMAVMSGSLKIAASTTIAQYLLPRWLGRFQQTHPHVAVELRMGNTEEVIGGLLARRVDLGLTEGLGARRELKAEKFYDDEIVAVAAPEHGLARKAKLTAADLAGAPCVLRESGSGTREVVERALRRARVDPRKLNVVLESSSSETIKGLVESGVGVGYLSRLALRHELARGTLVVLTVPGLKITRGLHVVLPQGPRAMGVAGAFVDFLQGAARQEKR